ncbi:MAG: hypothetical protein ACUVUR_03195, partial [bacterium]
MNQPAPFAHRHKRFSPLWLYFAVALIVIALSVIIALPRPHPVIIPCGPEFPHLESTYYGTDVLRKGEILSELLSRWCIPEDKIKAVYAALQRTGFNFRRMKQGDSVLLIYQGLVLNGIDYHPNPVTSYRVRFDSQNYALAQKVTLPVDTVKCVIRGMIENSLWNSLIQLGGTPQLVIEFAEILRYDIDFFTECNNGDTFELLVDRLEVQGRFYHYGRVYAVHYQSKRENVYGFYY